MNYLLDTNAILYFLKGKCSELPVKPNDKILLSFISKIELLSYADMPEHQKRAINAIIDNYDIVYVDDELVNDTIHIRKEHSLKLPDCIIVATAIQNNAVLVTADKQMLKKSSDIKLETLNPLKDLQSS